MLKKLAIYGAGWHGREVLQICRDAKMFIGDACFLDDKLSGQVDGFRVHPGHVAFNTEFAQAHKFVVAIGNNKWRLKIGQAIIDCGGEIVTVVHPSALVWDGAVIGQGTVIFPHAIVSVSANVGRFCIVNKHATVGHGAELGDGANLSDSSCLSGKLGSCSWMGLHAAAIPGVDIGANVTVGAGAVVLKSVPDGATVVGVPAREITYE